MIEEYNIIVFLFWICVLIFSLREIKLIRMQANNKDVKYVYWTLGALFVGVLIRTIDLSVPVGLFVDEAISGYDSWCLANYGVDQHLASNPVYLRSWGSGQSAFYAYLGVPFIKLFGLSIPVYRLPMALVSSFSLIFLYTTLRKTQKDYYFIFIVMLLIIISPWHIMKSRWALDCNLAPDFILIATCFFIRGYNEFLGSKKRLIYYLLGCLFLVASGYSYGVSWFMLPFYGLLIGVYLYKKNSIKLFSLFICFAATMILALPLILFAFNVVTNGQQYELGAITITALKESRHTITMLGGESTIGDHIRRAFHLFILGDDALRWNTFYLFGQFYNIVSLPFFILSFIFLLKKKTNIFDSVFLLWLVSSIPIIVLIGPNVNHWNIVWFPILYFVARGVYFCTEKIIWMRYMYLLSILCLFLLFSKKYIDFFGKPDITYLNGFFGGFEKYIHSSKDFDQIYFGGTHVYALFHNPISPYEFDKTKKVEDESVALEVMASYANYKFCIPATIEATPNTAYILRNNDLGHRKIDYSKFHVERGVTYTLLWTD